MQSLGRLGLALTIAGLATAANAAPDSPRSLPTEDWNAAQMDRAAPTQPDRSPQLRGGWSRGGWSDTIDGGAQFKDERRAEEPALLGQPGSMPREMRGRDMRRVDAADGWRRETWDGGRGGPFAYRRGGRLPPIFVSPDYAVPDWQAYGLVPPGPGRRWVRYYEDAVLIDGAGVVIDAVPAIGWDNRGSAPRGGWHDGGMAGYPAPHVDHRGPGPAPQVRYGPDGAMTIVITTAPSVATTTTTTTTSYVTTRRRVWKSQPRRLAQTKPARPAHTEVRR